uniref:Uncharacterized protein n=1 Tax=viral metagenome TaxID=1070528 RepID=A0A6C0DT34_9ZZZZ
MPRTRSRRQTRRRGGGCNVAPKGYTGAWHYEGNVKCKGDPPSNNNNGRNAAMAYTMKAYSPNGGRRRRGTRRSTRRSFW